ncbi:MAG: PE-PPE domain-containing protein [Mycobacterium sp.]|nr:PE-PPE domain-containing protein [Mycobacterium sp.]
MALSVAGAPSANARPVDITWSPTYTAGTIAGIINALGNALPGTSIAGLYNSGPPQSIKVNVNTVLDGGSIGLIPAEITLTLLLNYIADNNSSQYASTSVLYDTLANIPAPVSCANNSAATACRYALILGTSEATGNLAQAYRAQLQSVTTGQTPAGFIPFVAAPGSTAAKPTVTAQGLALLQNPLRPNGGLYSRFPDIAKALGVNPDMPAAGKYTSTDGSIQLNTTTVDATWAYDPMADFPEVFNLTAIANSLSAFLPLNLVTGGLEGFVLTDSTGATAKIDDIALNLAGLLKMPIPILGTLPDSFWGGVGKAYYATIVPNQLPLLAPTRLPGLAINAALGALNSPYLLGNPFADALEPALKILVNIAYDDVVVNRDPDTGVATYTRTFTKSGTPTPFGSVDPLTPEERAAVPGDVFNALLGGIQAQLAKPFWGILVPANPPEVTPPAAVKSVAPAASAASVAPQVNSVAVQESPVAPVVSIPEVEPQAATAESAPAATDVADIDAGALDAALAEEAAAQTPVSAARTTRAGDADQRRGASSADPDGSSRPPVSAGRGRAAG